MSKMPHAWRNAGILVVVMVGVIGFYYYYQTYINVSHLQLTIDVGSDTRATIEGQPHTLSSFTPSTCTVTTSGMLCTVEIPHGETAWFSLNLAFPSSGCAYPQISNSSSSNIKIMRAAGTTGECYTSSTAVYNFLITNTGSGKSSARITFSSTP